MRFNAFFIVLLMLIPFAARGQDKPQAELLDEFGQLSCCCDLGGRMDVFISELSANPGSVGYIILADSNSRTPIFREKYFDGYTQMRGFDENRIVIVRKSGFDDPQATQLWIVPQGSTIEGSYLSDSKYLLRDKKRKTLFFSGFFGDGDLCYTGPPFRVLAKYLRSDIELSANIAIAANSKRVFRKTSAETAERFRTVYQVDPTRLRFFHVQKNIDSPEYEIWIIRNRVR